MSALWCVGFIEIPLYKQPVYKQLRLDLQKVKQLSGLQQVTISNFTNRIFAYENIATTLHSNYSNLVRILIMQNSAHFGKNGVSNLVRKGQNFGVHL